MITGISILKCLKKSMTSKKHLSNRMDNMWDAILEVRTAVAELEIKHKNNTRLSVAVQNFLNVEFEPETFTEEVETGGFVAVKKTKK